MASVFKLGGIQRFASTPPWSADFEAILETHFGGALRAFDMTLDDVTSVLGEHFFWNLWGFAFEDLMSRRWPGDGRNLVEAYLKKHGWKENPVNRVHLRALGKSVVSLYEISDVIPGFSCKARDVLRGGPPVEVHEKSGTRSLKQWDRIAARVLPRGHLHMFSGAIVQFDERAVDLLLSKLVAADPAFDPEAGAIDEAILANAAQLFSHSWIERILPPVLGLEKRTYQNADGEPFVWHHTRFRLTRGTKLTEVADLLDTLEELRPEDRYFWNWLALVTTPEEELDRFEVGEGANAMRLTTSMDDGTPTLGTIGIENRVLTLETNSGARARRGTAMLQALLGNRIGKPAVEVSSLEDPGAQDDDEYEEFDDLTGLDEADAMPEIPDAQRIAIVKEWTQNHYRKMLDETIPALGNLSPRQAAASPKTRGTAVRWLKGAENSVARQGLRTDELLWMWEELGIAHLRQ